jgi:hypothetical protein
VAGHGNRIDARAFVMGERETLAKKIDGIRVNCANAPRLAMERFRARLEDIGQRLQVDIDADKLLSDPRVSKRVESTAKAGCRLSEREARMDAEPRIRAGKLAQKQAQDAKKARSKADKEVIKALKSDASTVDLVHVWKRVRDAMFEQAAAAGASTNPLDLFLAYVEANIATVQAEIAKIHARKKPGKKGSAPASEHVPASGARPSKRGTADQTQVSARPAEVAKAAGKKG